MFSYVPATTEILNQLWDKNIANHPGDERWVNWRTDYKEYNNLDWAKTFAVVKDGTAVGEGTLIFNPHCKATAGNHLLADGKDRVYLNALRIEKQYRGYGHISTMVKIMEDYARSLGYTYVTIGVDDSNEKNKAIYTHWGYTDLVFTEIEDGELVLYWGKKL